MKPSNNLRLRRLTESFIALLLEVDDSVSVPQIKILTQSPQQIQDARVASTLDDELLCCAIDFHATIESRRFLDFATYRRAEDYAQLAENE